MTFLERLHCINEAMQPLYYYFLQVGRRLFCWKFIYTPRHINFRFKWETPASSGTNKPSTMLGTTLQHSHNIAWMLSQRQSPMLKVSLPQHSPNIARMLSQCWPLSAKVVTKNIVFWSKFNVGMFTQYCLDIHTTLLGCLKVSTN